MDQGCCEGQQYLNKAYERLIQTKDGLYQMGRVVTTIGMNSSDGLVFVTKVELVEQTTNSFIVFDSNDRVVSLGRLFEDKRPGIKERLIGRHISEVLWCHFEQDDIHNLV